jgi:hypothetical protein
MAAMVPSLGTVLTVRFNQEFHEQTDVTPMIGLFWNKTAFMGGGHRAQPGSRDGSCDTSITTRERTDGNAGARPSSRSIRV